jgi:Beta-ketoacyl synthase, N-terminal domain
MGDAVESLNIMGIEGVRFSIASQAAWAPGIETPAAWRAWADDPFVITGSNEPGVKAMTPMLRRRAGFIGKMALEVAYQCLDGRMDVPTVFCSHHGEVSRSVDLLTDLANGEPLSPTAFGLSVHNATAGLFSIARNDRANAIALAAGRSSVEHAVIDACGLLADGEPAVLLVTYDGLVPTLYAPFCDGNEQPYAWAWLMQAAQDNAAAISLSWSVAPDAVLPAAQFSAGLEVLGFQLRQDSMLERVCERRRWRWTRHA